MTKNMTEGEPARLIFFFALPLVAGNMMQQLYAFIDTLIVGRFLGVNALAAVGCTGSLMFLTLGFIMGFCTGVTIYTGQRFGAGDHAGVRQSAAACILLGVALVLTLTAIVLPLTRTLLILMETPSEIMDGAYDFISIVFAGLVIFLLLYLQNCLIRALGDSKMPTILLAVTLGIDASAKRRLYMGLLALLTGVLVATCGIIGFVGLVVPHLVRSFTGASHRRLLPAALLTGAIFLVIADLLARTLLPAGDLPIGIITALIGAPLFMKLLFGSGGNFGGSR